MLASITYTVPLAVVERKRVLSCDGRVLVQVGSKVEAADIIAEGVVNTRHILLDIAKSLNVSSRRITSLMRVKKGQKINQGQLIAETTGLFAREVVAPADGRVVAVGGGKLILEVGGNPVEIIAGMPGIVKEIVADRGAVIRSAGSVIQGVWGNGRFDIGTLMSLLDHPDDVFNLERLDLSVRSSVILGGYAGDARIFSMASELPVKGLILTSMSPDLIPFALEAPYPVILLEGFGSQSLNPGTYTLISTNVRRAVTVNAVKFDRLGGEYPEVFIPLPISQDPPELRRADLFQPGQTVKLISLSRSSRIGILNHLIAGYVGLPNGLRVRAAEVQLDNGELVIVPLSNLRLVG